MVSINIMGHIFQVCRFRFYITYFPFLIMRDAGRTAKI